MPATTTRSGRHGENPAAVFPAGGRPCERRTLTAQLDRTTVALGEPVSLTVQARGLNLDALDVGPLGARFDVSGRTLSRDADSETLVLTLYPRAAGVMHIPSLQLDASALPRCR